MPNDETLKRNTYRDPTAPGDPVRTGSVAHAEAALDMDEFYRRLERLHGANLHEFGVASGLAVSAQAGAAGLTIAPGVAIDLSGRHISLAVGGSAEINPNAGDPTVPQSTIVPVAATGAALPTTGLADGNYFLTVQFWETFDQDAYLNLGLFRYTHTPWLRLQGSAPTDGNQILLARVTLVATQVTALVPDARRGTGLPAEYLHLRRPISGASGANLTIDGVGYAELRPVGADGGLSLAVPPPPPGAAAGSDVLQAIRTDGANLSKVSLAANLIAARSSAGADTVAIDPNRSVVIVGSQGNEGDVVVLDGGGNDAVTLDGGPAQVLVGGAQNPGTVRVLDADRRDRVRLLGSDGDMFFSGSLRDINLPAEPGVNNSMLRELTGHGLTNLHHHRLRPVFAVRLGTTDNALTVFAGVTLLTPTQVYASIVLQSMDPLEPFDRDDGLFADVYRVDGARPPGEYWFGGDHLGPDGADSNLLPAFFIGQAQTITFRLRNVQGCQVFALATVFTGA